MNDKYYTPSIEEFHVGFRYEYAEWWQRDITFVDYHTRTEESKLMWEERKIRSNYTSDGFFKRTVTTDDFSELKQRGTDAQQTFEKILYGIKTVGFDNRPQTPTVRVKYLDREDIEELGWKINSDDYYFKPKGIGEQYFLEKVKKDTWCITYEDHTGEIEEVEQLFLGKIKNYNELKKIMEWTGISG